MKLEFYFSIEKDIQLIEKWFDRVREVFGEERFNELIKRYYPECPNKTEEIVKYFKENQNKIIEKLKSNSEDFIKRWKKVEKEFFKQIYEITGFPWKYEKYRCHLSTSFVFGGCYDAKKGNEISIFPLAEQADPIETTFHELIHLHFWDVLDELRIKYPPEEKLIAKGKYWDLSEMEVNIPLSELKIQEYHYFPDSHVYGIHKKDWKIIKGFWKGNFKEFIINSVEYMEKIEDI